MRQWTPGMMVFDELQHAQQAQSLEICYERGKLRILL